MQRFVLVGILCLSSFAHAGDTKAWTAAKKVLPANLTGVIGINVSTLRGSDLYKQLMPLVLAQKPDAESHMKEIKSTCGNDVTALVDSVVVAMDQDNGTGEMIVALRSWTQKDVETCFAKMAKAHSAKLVTEKAGDFTHYQFGDKDMYLRWLSKDTVVIAHNKDAPTGGGIATDKGLAPLLAGVHTDAAVWAALNKTSPVPQSTAKVTGMFATVDVKGGNVSLDGHVLFDSEKGAADTATKTTAMLPMLTAQVPKMATIIKSMTFKANGKDLVVTASDTQKDIAAVVVDMVAPAQPGPAAAPAAK